MNYKQGNAIVDPSKKIWQPMLGLIAVCGLASSIALADTQQTPTPPAEPRAPQAPTTPRVITSPERMQVYMFGNGPYLGVDLRDITSDRVAPLKLREERGAEITMVDQDSPAGKSGLKEQDVVLTFNGTRVESVEQLRRMIHELPPGRTVTLGISRGGKPMTITAQLADRKVLSDKWKTSNSTRRIVVPPIPPIDIDIPDFATHVNTARIGIAVEPLTPQLGEYFGVPSGHGLLVRSVEKGSIADNAGLKAGDVIIKLGNDRVNDSGDWRMAIRDRTGAIPVTIVREKREQTLTVKLPERKQTGQYRVEVPGYKFDHIMASIGPQIDAATRAGIESASQVVAEASREAERAIRDSKVQIEREKTQMKCELEQEKKTSERDKIKMKREIRIRMQDSEML